MTDEEQKTDPPDTRRLTFLQMLGSTLAAAFGVQSSRNRVRDFSRGKASQFIFMGVAFTLVLVLIIVGIVTLILR